MPDAELDRATMWIKARQGKDGKFKDPAVEDQAKKIVSLYLVCGQCLNVILQHD